MNEKEKASCETGPKHYRPQILARVVATIKAAVVAAALWRLLPRGVRP